MTDGKTPYQIAQMAISDLIGYRKTSLQRSDDTDNLTNLLSVLMEPKAKQQRLFSKEDMEGRN